MFLELLLGVVQGVSEWLPISSSSLITIISSQLGGLSLVETVRLSVFLHLGTLSSLIVYFRKELTQLLKKPFTPLFNYLLIATIASGFTGIISYELIDFLTSFGKVSMIIVSVGLLITGLLSLKKKEDYAQGSLNWRSALIVGLAQGVAIIPGISRSGLTLATLSLMKFSPRQSVRISFLLSIPAVLMGNVFLKLTGFTITSSLIISMMTAFLVGLLTIKYFFKIIEKMSFAWFVIILSALNLLAIMI